MGSLLKTYVVVGPDQSATPVEVTPTIWEELDRRFDNFKDRQLVAVFQFEKDWPTWEMHPQGDEIVALVSGAAEMVIEIDGSRHSTTLSEPGAFVIVPKAAWHTARISKPTTMLFVTPGEGTENKVR